MASRWSGNGHLGSLPIPWSFPDHSRQGFQSPFPPTFSQVSHPLPKAQGHPSIPNPLRARLEKHRQLPPPIPPSQLPKETSPCIQEHPRTPPRISGMQTPLECEELETEAFPRPGRDLWSREGIEAVCTSAVTVMHSLNSHFHPGMLLFSPALLMLGKNPAPLPGQE